MAVSNAESHGKLQHSVVEVENLVADVKLFFHMD
jgi:hypothetical protein